MPGGEPRVPAQVNGAPAAKLPDGKVLRHRPVRTARGVRVAIDLVLLDGRYKLDLRRGLRRVARVDLPDLAGEGRVLQFTVETDDVAEQFYMFMEWVATDSQRVISRYVEGNASEFSFVN